MNMQEFYNKYKLNKDYFSRMAHVGARSLVKYSEGKPLREDTKARIEKAIRVVEKYNLVYPRFEGPYFDVWRNSKHFMKVQEYEKNFETLLQKEES